jgi:amidophosphoribosyltransferase
VIREDHRYLNTSSDSEVLLNVFAHELERVDGEVPGPGEIFRAAEGIYRRCRGGYAIVALIMNTGILGLRDPCGISPLVVGYREVDVNGASTCSPRRAWRSTSRASSCCATCCLARRSS